MLQNQDLINTFYQYFIQYFWTVSPFIVLVLYLPAVAGYTNQQKRFFAIKGSIIAFIFLILVVFFGINLLKYIGISISAIKVGCGSILFINAVLTFTKQNIKTNTLESNKQDLSIFPIAIPVISGPASISLTIILSNTASSSVYMQLSLLLAIFLNLLLTLILLILSDILLKYLHKGIINIIIILGNLIIVSLGSQYIIEGVKEVFTTGVK